MVPLIPKIFVLQGGELSACPGRFIPVKGPSESTEYDASWIPDSSLDAVKRMKSFSLLAADPRIVDCPARSLVTTPTEQSQLLNNPGMATGWCVRAARPKNYENK
jgi:hypothetical protein